jgi:predicted GIY-YIG superfamily endonuclease
VFEKAIGSRGRATSVERRIKKLSKAHKEKLIDRDEMIEQLIAKVERKPEA